MSTGLIAETVSEHDKIDLPPIAPFVERHRRLAVICPSCGLRVVADLPAAAKGTPFGPRLHAVATYLKTFQTLSYERLEGAFAASTIAAKRRALERTLQDILDTPTSCELARVVQNKFRRAKDQLLTFALWPGQVEATNNACERDLRPAVVQRKVTNGYRAMWATQGEADIRTVIDTARLKPGANRFQTILGVVSA